MILICEHNERTLERTCHICDPVERNVGQTREKVSVGIDETDLAWFYIAPGYENDTTSREMLTLARDLIGPNAWAVVQASDAGGQMLCSELGLRIVASYADQSEGPGGISVHVVNTGELV